MEGIMIISIILITLGTLPLFFVLIKRKRHRAFMQKAVITTAEVMHCEKRYGPKGATYYILSLQYRTLDDKPLQTVNIGAKKREKGALIPLMYLPDHPEICSIDFGSKTPVAIVLTFLFLVLIVGVCVWLSQLK